MVSRFYGYQYDTNPRKLSPENTQIRNRYSRNNKENKSNDEDETYLFERKHKTSRENESTSKINKTANAQPQANISDNTKQAKKIGNNIKPKLKIVMFLITGFSVLFAISYQNSLINESFNKKEQYKKEAEALSKTNQQMAVNIENNLNLNNIEQVAKEKIGMQKLSNNQKIYVSLPKVDYVAPATEKIIIEENTGFLGKVIKGFSKAIR